jgi:hypothetical protein
MGAFLDKFEGLVLDNARRIVSLFILLAMVVGFLYLTTAIINFADSPNTKIDDRFDVPAFEEPVENVQQREETQKSANSADSSEENQSEHPMPEYRDEIANIVENLYPFYVAFFNFEVSDERREYLTGFTAEELRPYQDAFNRNQMDEVVEGLEDYIDDFSEYHAEITGIDGLDIDEVNPGSMSNPEFERILENPYGEYLAGVSDAYDLHLEEVQSAEMEAQKNNFGALKQISIAGGSIAAIIFLVLLLILFKVENSIRRSADAAEKTLPEGP